MPMSKSRGEPKALAGTKLELDGDGDRLEVRVRHCEPAAVPGNMICLCICLYKAKNLVSVPAAGMWLRHARYVPS